MAVNHLTRMKVTKETLEQATREMDWQRVRATTDAEIAADPNADPSMTDAQVVAARVRGVRVKAGLSQPAFAARYHIPVATLRDWEQGRQKPDEPGLAYLRVIEREPEAVARALVT